MDAQEPAAQERGGAGRVLHRRQRPERHRIGEIWFWIEDRIEIHLLRGERYEPSDRSELFPALDMKLLCSFLDRPTAIQAVRAYRDALRP